MSFVNLKGFLFLSFLLCLGFVSGATLTGWNVYPWQGTDVTMSGAYNLSMPVYRWSINDKYVDIVNIPFFARQNNTFPALSGQTLTFVNTNPRNLNADHLYVGNSSDNSSTYDNTENSYYGYGIPPDNVCNFANAFDENFGTRSEIKGDDCDLNSLYVNYTIPDYSINITWGVKYEHAGAGISNFNITVPDSCIDYSTNLRLLINYSDAGVNKNTHFKCYSGTWNTLYTKTDADAYTWLYDEALYIINTSSYLNINAGAGYRNKGASFDGTTNYLKSDATFRLGRNTVCAWVYPLDNTSTYDTVYYQSNSAWLYAYYNAGLHRWRYSAPNGATNYATSVSYNSWQYVCGGYNSTHVFTCVDNVCSRTANASITSTTPNYAWVGAEQNNRYYHYGYVDELRVWNTSLTPAEMAVERLNTLPVKSLNLTLSFDFEQYNDTVVQNTYYYVGRHNGTQVISPAYYFDGRYNKVGMPANTVSNNPALSVSVWVKPEYTGDNQVVFHDRYSVYLGFPTNYKMYYLIGNATCASSYACADVMSDSAISLNNWTHIVGVYNGSKIMLYVNGVKQADTQSYHGNIYSSTSYSPTIGMLSHTADRKYKGGVSLFKLYNRSLSDDYVADLYASERGVVSSAVLADDMLESMDFIKGSLCQSNNWTYTCTNTTREQIIGTTFTTTNVTWNFTNPTNTNITTMELGADWFTINNDNISFVPDEPVNISILEWTGNLYGENNFSMNTSASIESNITINGQTSTLIYDNNYYIGSQTIPGVGSLEYWYYLLSETYTLNFYNAENHSLITGTNITIDYINNDNTGSTWTVTGQANISIIVPNSYEWRVNAQNYNAASKFVTLNDSSTKTYDFYLTSNTSVENVNFEVIDTASRKISGAIIRIQKEQIGFPEQYTTISEVMTNSEGKAFYPLLKGINEFYRFAIIVDDVPQRISSNDEYWTDKTNFIPGVDETVRIVIDTTGSGLSDDYGRLYGVAYNVTITNLSATFDWIDGTNSISGAKLIIRGRYLTQNISWVHVSTQTSSSVDGTLNYTFIPINNTQYEITAIIVYDDYEVVVWQGYTDYNVDVKVDKNAGLLFAVIILVAAALITVQFGVLISSIITFGLLFITNLFGFTSWPTTIITSLIALAVIFFFRPRGERDG